MKSNIGISDRAFRLFIGLSLIGLGVALETAWGLLGLIPLVTAGIGWCPLYCPLKIDTTEGHKSH